MREFELMGFLFKLMGFLFELMAFLFELMAFLFWGGRSWGKLVAVLEGVGAISGGLCFVFYCGVAWLLDRTSITSPATICFISSTN